MQVFVYEFVTGGGLWAHADWGKPKGSLLEEGRAMVLAVANDFAAIPNVDVVVMRDTRVTLPSIPYVQCESVGSAVAANARFDELAAASDKTLIIAPEIDNLLATSCERVVQNAGELVGVDLDFVRLTSDKHETTRMLAASGVPVPHSFLAPGPASITSTGPFVVKPRFGAGSSGVRVIQSATDITKEESNTRHCIQEFVDGRAASVTVIRGARSHLILPPCWQSFSPDSFEYTGGSIIADEHIAARARALARHVIDAFSNSYGYFGVDLILGSSDDGRDDVVIEINPRLTTSYVGLRSALSINLADVLLRVLADRTVELPTPNFTTRFEANGTVAGGI